MGIKILLPIQLGIYIKDRRIALGMSQLDLGKKIGVRQARISKIESDAGSISVNLLFKILSVLNLQIELNEKSLSNTKGNVDGW